MRVSDAGPHILYRLYDADGDLLYIGITNDMELRLYIHENTKHWWRDVVEAKLEQNFESRRALEHAERVAIIAECPRYNVLHNDARFTRRPPEPPRPPRMTAREALELALAPLTDVVNKMTEPRSK